MAVCLATAAATPSLAGGCASGDADGAPNAGQAARGGTTAEDAAGGSAGSAGSGGSGNDAGGGQAGSDAGDECGNAVIDSGEDCDDGNAVSGDGCEPGCFYSCTSDSQCNDYRPCNGAEICTPAHVCSAGTALPNGRVCGDNKSCRNGYCVDNSSTCGDGLVAADEECDDGNASAGDGCNPDCRFSCVSTDPLRDCQDACRSGAACDDVTHLCSSGTPRADGTPCGENWFCRSGSCAPASCGDGQVQGAEECDDTNGQNGDGCDNDCRFSCQSSDPTRNCALSDPCQGTSSCNDTNHVCSTPTPLAEGAACGPAGRYCHQGACKPAACGDGLLEPGEECDDGNSNDSDGCRTDCTFTCRSAADCADNRTCTADVCNTASHTCSNTPDTNQNGQSCNEGGVTGSCQSGVCTPIQCGNGLVEPGEQCDRGAQNGPGSGCTQQCQFECNTNAGCDDANPCNGTETCGDVLGGKRCTAGSPLNQGAVCGSDPRRVCTATQSCVSSRCGDAIVDTGGGEQCDDGNTSDSDGCRNDCLFTCTSNAQCSDGNPCTSDACNTSAHTCSNPADTSKNGSACTAGTAPGTCTNGACVPAQCGNSVVEGAAGEECDKGSQNGQAGSGCTSGCKFECASNANCSDGNPCNGAETCAAVSGGRTCLAGTPLSQGEVCQTSPRRICDASRSCVTSACGDGWLDAGAGEQCEPPNTPTCDATCKAQCDLNGVWGLKISSSISWSASAGIVAGTGPFVSWAKLTRTLSGTVASDVSVACGLSLPDFSSIPAAGSELYGVTYPNSIFDLNTLASFTATASFASRVPGASFSSSDSASLLGLTLSNPLTSPWPSNATLQQVDHDSDTKPGVTAPVKQGGSYRMIPVEGTLTTRANALYMALRQVTALTGAVDSCTQISGSATLVRMDRLVVGCRRTTGEDCTTAQRDFLSTNSFAYVVPATLTFRMVKLAGNATCSDVRGALP